ncbi:MAG: hypothetical protein AAFV95_27405 [Bacteroidota bacterium]
MGGGDSQAGAGIASFFSSLLLLAMLLVFCFYKTDSGTTSDNSVAKERTPEKIEIQDSTPKAKKVKQLNASPRTTYKAYKEKNTAKETQKPQSRRQATPSRRSPADALTHSKERYFKMGMDKQQGAAEEQTGPSQTVRPMEDAYLLKVATYKDKATLTDKCNSLRAHNLKVWIQQIEQNAEVLFRVYIGTFEKTALDNMTRFLKKKGWNNPQTIHKNSFSNFDTLYAFN